MIIQAVKIHKDFSGSKKLQMENGLYKCVGVLRLVVFKN